MSFDPGLHVRGRSLRECMHNLLHDVIGIDQIVIECLSFRPDWTIFDSHFGEVIGVYKLVDDALPVVGFTHEKYMHYNKQKRVGALPNFVPRNVHQHNIGIMVEGDMAPPELHSFLMSELFTTWMDKPGYRIRRNASPFFQGGAHEPNGKWFYIEFLGRRDIYKVTAWINENFRYPV